MQTLQPDPADQKEARRYARKLRDFYTLLAVAAGVIVLAATLDLVKSPDRLWFPWVVFGFALAIAFSALDVFGRSLWFGPDWKRRQIDKRLRWLRERR